MIKRRSFAKIAESMAAPNLVEVQTASYETFLQREAPKTKREPRGLQAAFQEIFPIESYDGRHRLEFLWYALGHPKYNIEECLYRGMTYAAPLKVKLRLVSDKEAKEQEVFLGDIPLMTETGTLLINGDERVIVSQMHRSPGVFFEEALHPSGKRLYSARIIPYRGAWIEFEFDLNDVLYVYIDRRRKMLATALLRVLGYPNDEEILQAFATTETVECATQAQWKKVAERHTATLLKEPSSGEALLRAGGQLTEDLLQRLWELGFRKLKLLVDPPLEILRTLERDPTHSREDALMDIYRRVRPGDMPNLQSAHTLVARLFTDPRRYDVSRVGRFVLNRKLGMRAPLDERVLTRETIVAVMKYLVGLRHGEGEVDDIDHLGNRRVRSVGELVQNQVRIGLERLERSIQERMAIYDLAKMMPHNLVNFKLVSSVVRDFFARSQLSQFMDQTNPLAELTHKRRLSALGPGGLSRERAGFEVRDVHHSHYGRICPIETPEGPNIGLISSLTTYSRINQYGFIETSYRRVEKGVVTTKVDYLTADQENQYLITQANALMDKQGRLLGPEVTCRYRGNFPKVPPKDVQYIDVSPTQLVSIAASLIPFLEHDDANRALMGSNMQRQAVPLLTTEAALIGTGMEYRTAVDSGACVLAAEAGVVRHVQADAIVIGKRTYRLRKFQRSNANTCLNQRPLVHVGQSVKAGQVIADGPATHQGELALGKNILVCFMPWRGYNFEDAILISQRLVREDTYTSIYLEEFELEARETRLGNEDITRDIPNVSEEALKDLDEQGIVRIGAEVGPRDVLVGKVTPKSETELSPEEKLLRAIFGEKAGDVRDASLRVPAGVEGIIVGVKVFARKGAQPRTKEDVAQEHAQVEAIRKHHQAQMQQLREERVERLTKLLSGKRLAANLLEAETRDVVLRQNRRLLKGDMHKLIRCDLDEIKLTDEPELEHQVRRIVAFFDEQIKELSYEEELAVDKIKRGDELPPGVIKRVVVQVASKRKVQVGDKVAGRHGNKGVIAKILPDADMPYLPDGTPVDMVLNPLGVPSRMNVGQILETHLGWAAQALGVHCASPVFNGATETEIKAELRRAGLPADGKTVLHDGFTGEPFDQKVTVGYLYMIKLAHLVDDKIHARSIGPYSLVTQQPLGGKAQFGGQRFGEMEVWALEAYGVAYTLQELLTVKSDDVIGRTRIYEAIVKGEMTLQPSTPESFNVLVKELQSLVLDVRLERSREETVDASARFAERLKAAALEVAAASVPMAATAQEGDGEEPS